MFRRLGPLAGTALLVAGCSSLGGEIPGLFYYVQLREAQPSTVCMELATELVKKLDMHVVDQVFPARPKGQCIVELGDPRHPQSAVTTIGWNPGALKFSIRVAQFGQANAAKEGARDLASEVIGIAHEKYPDAVITPYSVGRTIVGP